MIVNLKFKNYRSYRDAAEFSFEALDSDVNSGAITTTALKDGSVIRLLNSAAIFGANASGKSNVIHALRDLSSTVDKSRSYIPDYKPHFINPYAFDQNYLSKDTVIEIGFLFEGKRYLYTISGIARSGKQAIISNEILSEIRNGNSITVFNRNKDISISVGDEFPTLRKLASDNDILPNQLFLSSLATKDANGLQYIANYLASLAVFDGNTHAGSHRDRQIVMESVIKNTDSSLFKKLEKLLRIADLGINKIKAERNKDSDFSFPTDIDNNIKQGFIENFRWNISLGHQTTNPREICLLPFEAESEGTKAIFGVGARLLDALQNGAFIAYDEINDSIHPAILRFIVSLFHSPLSNPKGAQLLFSTHDASVADHDTFRADQVWFVEKHDSVSDLFSAQDFSDVGIRVPFEMWYRSGRFGALPSIGEFEDIFQ